MHQVPLLALLLFATAAGAGDPLELKGLRIGQAAADVQSTHPDLACKTLAEGLEECDKPDTLNTHEAVLKVYFLDGALISASYQRLPLRSGKAIADLFNAKFGAPAFTNVRNEMNYGTREYESLPSPVWERDGYQLQVTPFAIQDRKERASFTTVRLVDGLRWDAEWLPRLRDQEARSKVPADQLKAADI